MASESLKSLVITSIGTAGPNDAASVALGLGVSVPHVISAFYRAPTTLVDRLPDATATAVAELLASLGCEVEIVPSDSPPPELAQLLDVAVHITDEARFEPVAAAAATFLGCPEEEARRLLLATPPVLLGQVSSATVEALRHRLGEGVSVLSSDPALAGYDVLLGECPAVHRARLLADLRAMGFDPDTGPWVLRGLTKDQADAIWARHRRTPSLQVTNQNFYRYEVVLNGGEADATTTAALTSTGVPVDVVPRLFNALPVIVADELSERAAKDLIAKLTQVGLEVHAELTTFLQLGVRVNAWTSPTKVRATLRAAGLKDPPDAIPFVLGPWPELTARLVRNMLVSAGTDAELADGELVNAGGRA